MITSADAYIGKSFKYLAIFDKSLRKLVVSTRSDNNLTADYLVEVLTPGTIEEIPTNIIPPNVSETSMQETIDFAKSRVITLINILHANYWSELSEVIFARKKWSPTILITQFLIRGDRSARVIYNILIELYVYITVLRTAEDGIDMSIKYETMLA